MNTEPKQNWSSWYIAVIGILLIQIALYYLFTQYWA